MYYLLTMKNQMPSKEKIEHRLASWKSWAEKMGMLRQIHAEIEPLKKSRQAYLDNAQPA